MPQFLVSVEVPPSKAMSSSPGYPHEWTQFENAASTILKNVKHTTKLQRHTWLLAADSVLPVLMELGALASRCNLEYSCVLIPDGSTVVALAVKPKS